MLPEVPGLTLRVHRAAGLGVDSDNPSGALALYERAGFEVHMRSTAFRKRMQAA